MTHPFDRLSVTPPPDDEPEIGTEPGELCGRWQEPDEDFPVAWQCGGTITTDGGVTACDICGETP